MNKSSAPPAMDYGFKIPPPAAPPSYSQVVGGVGASSPFVPPPQTGMTIVTTVVPVGPNSTHTICPNCRKEIDTRIKKEPSLAAYTVGLVLCLVGCFCGCCLIPCCMDECKNTHHTCPECGTYLGRFRR